MTKILVIYILFLLSCIVYGWLPEGIFPKCKVGEEDFIDCIMETIYSLREHIKKDGLVGLLLDPYIFKRKKDFKIEHPLITFEGQLIELTVLGAMNFRIKSLSINENNNTKQFLLFFPKIDMLADYQGKGTFTAFPLASSGRFYATLRNVNAKVVFVTKNMKDKKSKLNYLKLEDVSVNLEPGSDSSTIIQPLPSKAEESVSKLTGMIINTLSSKDMLEIIKPQIEKTMTEEVYIVVASILRILPLQQVLEY